MSHLNHELEKGEPNGLASLGSGAKLASSQTPWRPPAIGSRDRTGGNGAPFSRGGNFASLWYTLEWQEDHTLHFSMPLKYGKVEYDGSTLMLVLYIAVVSDAHPNEDLRFIVDYNFLDLGDDGKTKVSTINKTEDVNGWNAYELHRVELGNISGNAGARVINIRITRNSDGGGSDTFPDDMRYFGAKLEKV